jgi:hypothetical protein
MNLSGWNQRDIEIKAFVRCRFRIRLLAVYHPLNCPQSGREVEPAPDAIVRTTCIYHLSWNEIPFFHTLAIERDQGNIDCP